jgi:hypothetical protein
MHDAYTSLMRDADKQGFRDPSFYSLKDALYDKTYTNHLLHQKKSHNDIQKMVMSKRVEQQKILEKHTYNIVQANVPNQWLYKL